ncbi:hypothetical protein E2C01_070521 [Portunus trituberculatus]|uniref:Uncharacterized protein n=1 Tax=Portunus trituberculatus TaxID=210409 RepID=A0A5B7I2B5_PORTR|nr:hypothetical protein [Portunus trituberculatus]
MHIHLLRSCHSSAHPSSYVPSLPSNLLHLFPTPTLPPTALPYPSASYTFLHLLPCLETPASKPFGDKNPVSRRYEEEYEEEKEQDRNRHEEVKREGK